MIRHAGLDPASSAFVDSGFRRNDVLAPFHHRSNEMNYAQLLMAEGISSFSPFSMQESQVPLKETGNGSQKRRLRLSKWQIICLSVVLVLSVNGEVLGETTENLLSNPGFEQVNLSNWPVGWGTNSSANTSSDNQTARPGGSRSLRISLPVAAGIVRVAQGIQVIPGSMYNLSAWIKTENVTGPGALVFIEWTHQDGTWYWGNWDAPMVTGSHDWQFTSVENVQIPQDAGTNATVFVALLAGSAGTAWFDDVLLQRLIDPLMSTSLVPPINASKILPGAPSREIEVAITLNPVDYGLTLAELRIVTILNNSTGTPVEEEDLDPVSSYNFPVNLDIADGLPPGDYQLIISLYKGEDLLAQDTYPLEKVSGLSSYIDSHNRFILNGEPFFPLGLYLWYNGIQYPDPDELDDIKNSPFDTLMQYNTAVTSDAENTAFLQALNLRGLKLIFSLYNGGCNDQNTVCEMPWTTSGFETFIEHEVTTFKEDPAIIAWYLNDEICPVCLDRLEAGYNKIKELDGNHPVWSVHWHCFGQDSWLLQELHTTDIVGVDPHPNPITLTSDMADAANATGKPVWLAPQIYGATQAEMRAMTYLAVNHGAKGLIYYCHSAFNPTKWSQAKGLGSEVDQLRPVFLSTDQTNDSDVTCNNSNIDLKLMRTGHAYYLFAVNTKEENITGVSFQNNLSDTPGVIEALFEDGRQIALTNGAFTDNFDPYEVHVYFWRQHGDVDCDGIVDLADAILTFQTVAGLSAAQLCLSADVNEDGKIGLFEVIYILQYIAGLR
jgi:hypothetical protein